MDGYQLISLKEMLDTIGEERVKAILSNFSCPLNGDAPGDRMQGLAKSDRGWDLSGRCLAALRGCAFYFLVVGARCAKGLGFRPLRWATKGFALWKPTIFREKSSKAFFVLERDTTQASPFP